jgi:hypothetical protein
VNQAVLKHLYPVRVDVEICHTEELAQRQGLTSEFDLVIGLFLKRYESGRTHLTGNQQL